MSLIRDAFEPKRSLSYQDVWGTGGPWPSARSQAGETVTAAKAFGIATAWACGVLLADTVASMPVDTYRKTADGTRRPVNPPPQLVVDPSNNHTAREWKFQAVISLAFWGNAYGLVTDRDMFGRPISAEWAHPEEMTVITNGFARPAYTHKGRKVDPDNVLHLRRYTQPGSPIGMSPLAVHKETLGLGLAARRFASEWFASGAHPTGLLISDQEITKDTAEIAKNRFLEAVRSRKPAALGKGWKYEDVQSSPADSELAKTFNRIGVEVCQAFRVQPEMVGLAAEGSSSITYANREQRSIDFLTYTVNPWLLPFEDMWTANLARPQFAKFNTGSLLRSDLKSRYDAHAVALRAGFKNADEIRALEDLEAIPDGLGEIFYHPTSVVPVEREQA